MTVDDGNFERTKDCDSLITDSPHRARVRGETASELQWQAHDYDERSDNAHLVSTTDKVSVSYAKRAGSPAGIVFLPTLPPFLSCIPLEIGTLDNGYSASAKGLRIR